MNKILKNVLKIAAALIVVAVIGVVVISYGASGKLVSPVRDVSTVTPLDLGIAYDEVRYQTADDVTIRAWFVPASAAAKNANSRATIILAHGYPHNKAQMNEYMTFLHARGFNVLSFDFRACGESGGKFVTIGANEPKDIDAAVEWLKANHPKEAEKIGILGISMGAATSILATANNKKIDAIVSDSAFAKLTNAIDSSFTYFAHLPAFPFSPLSVKFAEWRAGVNVSEVLPEKYIHDIAPRPILIIHSKVDTIILHDKNALPLYEAAGNPKQLWSVEGGGHVENHSFAGKEYEEKVDKFFEDSLIGKAPVAPPAQKAVGKKKK